MELDKMLHMVQELKENIGDVNVSEYGVTSRDKLYHMLVGMQVLSKLYRDRDSDKLDINTVIKEFQIRGVL